MRRSVVLGAAVLAFLAFRCHAERRGSQVPATAGVSGAVLLSGRVDLPPIHPMMLFPRRVRGRDHIDSGMNQALDEQLCGYLDKQQPRFVYGLKEMRQLKLGGLLTLRVVPWKGSGSAQAVEGVVGDDGSFRVEVPRSLTGYTLTISGGDVKLKARVPPFLLHAGRAENIHVGLLSTALAELADAAGPDTSAQTDEQLAERLGPKVKERADGMRDLLTYGLWVGQQTIAQTNKPYYTFKACTSDDPDPACYRRGERVPYALMRADQLPSDAVRWRPAGLVREPGDAYADQGLRVAPYLPAGVAPGAASDAPRVEEQAGGFLLVRPVGDRGGVDLVFETGVHAVGMTIQNGDTHADTQGAFSRRGFRFLPMDRYGAPIEEFRWYTNQGEGGPGFYGFASDTPIHRVRVEVRSAGPFSVGALQWSATYPEAIAENLGWTASGNWKIEESGADNTAFIHPYFQGYEEHFGDQFLNLRERPAESSGGRYWHVGYGATADPQGSTLASPAFTLNNLDLDLDDVDGFSTWISGVTWQTQAVPLMLIGADGKTYKYETTGNPTCRIGGIDFLFDQAPFPKPRLMPGCTDKAWEGKYVGGMDTHWGHFHFRANIDVPPAAQWQNVTSGPDHTERYVEYSTDNGATWRQVYWWPDQSHHGLNGVWWKNHGHGLYDSDMVGVDWNGNGQRGTDFNKDGVDDYIAPEDNNGNGIVDADPHGDDAREWDTEWYMEFVPPSQWRDVDDDGFLDPEIEGVTIRYRLRFVGPNKPERCGSEDCFGWKVDDFAINNDNPRVGYFTTFSGAFDANLR